MVKRAVDCVVLPRACIGLRGAGRYRTCIAHPQTPRTQTGLKPISAANNTWQPSTGRALARRCAPVPNATTLLARRSSREPNASAPGSYDSRFSIPSLSPLHIKPRIAHTRLHIGHRQRIEIARNRMLQTAGGQAEAHRVVQRPAFDQAVQHAGRKGVAAANAVDDGGEFFAGCTRHRALAWHQHRAQLW